MAIVRLQVSSIFPPGTSVGAYQLDHLVTSAPTIPPLESATVDVNGVLTFSTLPTANEYVAYAAANGRALEFTNPAPGRGLSGLSDVDATGVTNGQVLAWNTVQQLWLPAAGASVPDATTGSKGIVQLAGDLAGTAAVPTVPGMVPKTLVDAKGDLIAATAADTVARFGVGANGTVLTSDSSQASGLAWNSAPGGGIPPTIVDAKGDVIAATAADTVARLAVGADGTVLTAASGQATGLQWATPTTGISATVVDVKGDLIAATGADVVARFAAGTDGQMLLADSSQAAGLRWATEQPEGHAWAIVNPGAATLLGDSVWIPSGRTAKLARVQCETDTGTVDFRIQRAASGGAYADITGFGTSGSPLQATSTFAVIDPTDVALTDGDRFRLIISAVGSAPGSVSITYFRVWT